MSTPIQKGEEPSGIWEPNPFNRPPVVAAILAGYYKEAPGLLKILSVRWNKSSYWVKHSYGGRYIEDRLEVEVICPCSPGNDILKDSVTMALPLVYCPYCELFRRVWPKSWGPGIRSFYTTTNDIIYAVDTV